MNRACHRTPPCIKSSHPGRADRIQVYRMHCHLGAGTVLQRSCSRETTEQNAGHMSDKREWGSVQEQSDASIKSSCWRQAATSSEGNCEVLRCLCCLAFAICAEDTAGVSQPPEGTQGPIYVERVGQSGGQHRTGLSLPELGHFIHPVRPGGILVTACNCSVNVNFLIHIKMEEESEQERPRGPVPDRWASCQWVFTGPHPASQERWGPTSSSCQIPPLGCENFFREALVETLGQREGEERAAAVFGPRFCLYLLVRIESVESHMLVKQTNLYGPKSKEMFEMLSKISEVGNHSGLF